MVIIDVKKFLPGHYSNADGNILYDEIAYILNKGEKIKVSFKGINGLNSSFVNSAFIQLLNDFSFDYIKENLSFTDTSKQINQLILSRFKFEMNRKMTV